MTNEVCTKEVEYDTVKAAVGEMIGDVVMMDTGHSDVNEPAQAKRGYIVERLANNMVDPGLEFATTVVCTMDIGVDHHYMDKASAAMRGTQSHRVSDVIYREEC